MSLKKTHSLARALSVAADMFTSVGYDSVSIAQIAAASHCSTATIYAAFETKERLFLNAMLWAQRALENPELAMPATDEEALENILNYCWRRIDFLSDTRSRNITLAVVSMSDKTSEGLDTLFKERDQLASLITLIESSMRAGHLVRASSQTVGYCLMTAISFEPLMLNLYLQERADPHALIRTALEPFVTDAGAGIVQHWIAERVAAPSAPADRDSEMAAVTGVVGAHRAT